MRKKAPLPAVLYDGCPNKNGTGSIDIAVAKSKLRTMLLPMQYNERKTSIVAEDITSNDTNFKCYTTEN